MTIILAASFTPGAYEKKNLYRLRLMFTKCNTCMYTKTLIVYKYRTVSGKQVIIERCYSVSGCVFTKDD